MTVFEIKATDRTQHYLYAGIDSREDAQMRLYITAIERAKCTIILFLHRLIGGRREECSDVYKSSVACLC